MEIYLQKVKIFCWRLEVKDENSRIRGRIRIHWLEARIRIRTKCRGSTTLMLSLRFVNNKKLKFPLCSGGNEEERNPCIETETEAGRPRL